MIGLICFYGSLGRVFCKEISPLEISIFLPLYWIILCEGVHIVPDPADPLVLPEPQVHARLGRLLQVGAGEPNSS